MEALPIAIRARILSLDGSPLTEAQRGELGDAYDLNPGAVERALDRAERVAHATAYLISAVRGINREEKSARSAPPGRAQRHDLDVPECRDCGDSGFVTLIRDVGDSAFAGDAAPCHCDVGLRKQKRYGTVHYTRDDYEPVLPDPDEVLITLREYAQSEAGRADPNLEAMRAVYRKLHEKGADLEAG